MAWSGDNLPVAWDHRRRGPGRVCDRTEDRAFISQFRNHQTGDFLIAIPYAQPGDVVDITPLGERLLETQTNTLVKTDSLEVLRRVLPAGKQIAPHAVPGEITVQCCTCRTPVPCSATVFRAGGQFAYGPEKRI